MNESLTLSRKSPGRSSMDYTALRDIGIQRIQELAGQLWTDYNTHDPGVTILEVLSYVLTDMGYRVNYDIKDILAQDFEDPDYYDIKNFYTACNILPVCPVTFDDYRKLIIDVDVYDPSNPDCLHAGVKNAWIEKSEIAEHKIYVDRKKSKLSLSPIDGITPSAENSYYVGVLYNILLEFDECDAFGDLNSSRSEHSFQLPDPDVPLAFIETDLRVDFRRWDEADVNWDAALNIAMHIEEIRLQFPERSVEIVLNGGLELSNITSKRGELDFINNAFLSGVILEIEKLFQAYQLKVAKIFEIIAQVKRRLHSNRNLCEDFFQFNALKVEEILLCSDIELSAQADVETVQAQILHDIANFLSPKVYFYTIEEMMNRCNSAPQYNLAAIKKNKKLITIAEQLQEDLNPDDTITLLASEANRGEYTVKCVRQNKDNPNYIDIEVLEEMTSEAIDEAGYLIKGTIDEDRCLTVDQVFEGPKLKNGFIDNEELENAKRRKNIHVSDLIRIIMDVEGVVAVKEIQIANRPQDNDANIESKSVKWCLDLAFKNNYVPRLNSSDSKLTFYKGQLPFLADDDEVAQIMENLKSTDRPQKRFREDMITPLPDLDIPVPFGEFKDLENYTSLQEDFPLVYGIGSEGIAGLAALDPADKALRKSQAKQLKGFLMFFDQLAANYLSQLNHVKDLFSMNGEKNEFGEYKIDKTYFSQTLFDTTSTNDPLNLRPLYVDPAGHLVALRQIVEDQELYERRRNKFLDHLLGRFAETFTDYALLMYKTEGAKAGAELIEDKLKFLNAYPQLSAARGKAIDYLSPCESWCINNISGLEMRAGLLTGMAMQEGKDLVFTPNFKILGAVGTYTFGICKQPSNDILLESPDGMTFETEAALKIALEKVVLNGVCKENYHIIPTDIPETQFKVQLICDGEVLAESQEENFTSKLLGGDADLFVEDVLTNIMSPEFFDNHESNRKNLSMPIQNYIRINNIIANLTPPDNQPPQYEIDYDVFEQPFDFSNSNLIFSGTMIGAASTGDDANTVMEKGEQEAMGRLCELIMYAIDRKQYALIDEASNNFKFVLCNNRGVEIGRSIQKNFNEVVTAEIDFLNPKEVTLGALGVYELNNAINRGVEVEIELKEAPPVEAIDEPLLYTQSFNILSTDTNSRSIEVEANIAADPIRFYDGDVIAIKDSTSNDGAYTILRVEETGTTTNLYLKEAIPSNDYFGRIELTRSFTITKIIDKTVVIKGGEEERAIQKLINFFTAKFMSHEGFHVIEHTLLRPRIKEPAFVSTTPEMLNDSLGALGYLYFRKAIPIESVRAGQNVLVVAGDLTGTPIHARVTVNGNSPNDGNYTIESMSFNKGKTLIKVNEDILFDLPAPGLQEGFLNIYKRTPITKVNAATQKVQVKDAEVLQIALDDHVAIWRSEGRSNDGKYKATTINALADGAELTLGEKEIFIEDSLLPVYFDKDECESCNIIDPYSCIVSVVLPYWPGRFTNLDIRKYIEQTIRTEAPAHLLLNICWVDCERMEDFERQYKNWLIQISKAEKNKAQLVQALKQFIDSISNLRNIHPSGTLHSCDDDDTFEGSIILNNSVLGTF